MLTKLKIILIRVNDGCGKIRERGKLKVVPLCQERENIKLVCLDHGMFEVPM